MRAVRGCNFSQLDKKSEKNLLISSEKFAVIKPSGGKHVSFI